MSSRLVLVALIGISLSSGCSSANADTHGFNNQSVARDDAGANSAVEVQLSDFEDGCLVQIGADEYRLPNERPHSLEQQRLEARLALLASQHARMTIVPARNGSPSYRCFGSLIFLGQQAGLQIGFVSESPSQ